MGILVYDFTIGSGGCFVSRKKLPLSFPFGKGETVNISTSYEENGGIPMCIETYTVKSGQLGDDVVETSSHIPFGKEGGPRGSLPPLSLQTKTHNLCKRPSQKDDIC